ncbi:MAG: hypothetical protein H0V66_08615 [Bdellovibrionales bacterium]|nr:hypothetical protein [Bdellovibrionales bacterium]
MKQIFAFFILLSFSTFAQSQSELKVEGNCKGDLRDGSKVSFTYYSNFNGCQQKINAAIKLSPSFGSQYVKGKREFENSQDIYTMNDYRITFKDSTGNTSGVFSYLDVVGKRQSVDVQCEIRDYEYDECEN